MDIKINPHLTFQHLSMCNLRLCTHLASLWCFNRLCLHLKLEFLPCSKYSLMQYKQTDWLGGRGKTFYNWVAFQILLLYFLFYAGMLSVKFIFL